MDLNRVTKGPGPFYNTISIDIGNYYDYHYYHTLTAVIMCIGNTVIIENNIREGIVIVCICPRCISGLVASHSDYSVRVWVFLIEHTIYFILHFIKY